ncbi:MULTISPECIES: alpha/beta fold hydrolase [Streptomyces]|uniref:Putative ABC transporter ATP-binding protein n=1 Tax=Streptomyces venezuelae (strain ATCC 10712 / CBS 650.69 / DSM 40230 / JCM 4526 / NBRC 13096 / PD 04745) TaxID=953739 RepID=F2RDE6_STRVP|nr:alpha/beta fold hydrolase [Streptomyces venezuelae]APE24915.1 acyl esterase [Streptomyces venezuelae]QES02261.1 alpha/beta fold hydrolase [Streptomyces venezuelae ATCC 10712]CCA59438.1 putative ABC transporter ATP-binding protein [Streptomyces venezuelae ATCC 10712]
MRRTPLTLAVSAALVAGAAFGLAPAAQAGEAGQAAGTGIRFVDITGEGGTVLKANVVSPAGSAAGARHPLIVLPTSWAMPQIEYLAQAQQLADSGYIVLSYNSRGFWQSGGEIETAGPKDIADASKVIDWALAHTAADPANIGMAGVSYGAGISLLAAAHDPRIKAVAALSGWADLIESIYSGRTQHLQAAALLGGAGYLTGRPGPELKQILGDFLSSNLAKEEDMIAWGRQRSAAEQLDRINANGAAIMLGNAWGDTIFPPNQYASFFEKLTGPKRLEFRPGDHATAEATGLLGLPNDTWTSAHRWFDRYLKGADNGIDREQPVQLKSRSTGGYEGYPDWKSVHANQRKFGLDGTQKVWANVDSGANGGTVLLTNALDQFLRTPPIVSVPLLPRAFAGVWQSERSDSPQRVRGTVKVHTTVTSTEESGTLVAYLYDVGPLGVGKLVSNAPYTFHDRTPGKPFGVDLELFSTAYDVPAGHRLALVVDTVDPLYAEHNPTGAQLTFSSPSADPSYVSVPLRSE